MKNKIYTYIQRIKYIMELHPRVRDIMNHVAQIAAHRDKLEQDKASVSEELKDPNLDSLGRKHLHKHLLELHAAATSHMRTIMTYLSAVENILDSQRLHSHQLQQQQAEGEGPFQFCLHCNVHECTHCGPA